MSEALYRKYRPHKFVDVIGQEHVVKVLESEVKSGEISHAYLFAGTRGTGKTSVARIFAAEIGTTPNDIYEIDAASNTGVDDIRTLNESVFTLPFESKYKVYIYIGWLISRRSGLLRLFCLLIKFILSLS